MSVLIIGASGSMGRRYQAILNFLGKPFVCADKETTTDEIDELAQKSSRIIVATPTHTHAAILTRVIPLAKPILCEAPVTMDMPALKTVLELLDHWNCPFRMMFQYEFLADADRLGPSLYNYFKHGNDGLIWDCIQIIALSRGKVELKESSAIWSCKINGKSINPAHMDAAYVAYVQKWFLSPRQRLDYIEAVHKKVIESEKKVTHGQYH